LHQNRFPGRNLYDIDNIAFVVSAAVVVAVLIAAVVVAVAVADDLSAPDSHGVH
jgi:hypothetical protein